MHRTGCRRRRWTSSWLPGFALGVWLLGGGFCSAQAPAQGTKPEGVAANPGASSPLDPAKVQLQADTDRLVKLSRELKAEVSKSTKDTLSVTVIRKAAEVEMLAKSLREQMSKVR